MDLVQKTNQGFAIAVAAAFLALTACTPSDHATEGRDDNMVQNSAEAEAAEARLVNADQPKATEAAVPKTAASKTAALEKGAKAKKAAKEPEAGVQAAAEAPKAEKAKSSSPEQERHPASAGGVYVVQVGAFKIKENAERLEASLKKAGFPVAMHTIEHSKNGILHLVQFAPVASRAEAETVIEELQAKQSMQAQLVMVPHAH